MSRLFRPSVCGPLVFCLVLGALYFFGSTGDQAFADKSSKGGLPAMNARMEDMEDAMLQVFVEMDSQRLVFNAVNFTLNTRINSLDARLVQLEGGGVD